MLEDMGLLYLLHDTVAPDGIAELIDVGLARPPGPCLILSSSVFIPLHSMAKHPAMHSPTQ